MNNWKAHLLLLITAFIFGANFSIAKVAMDGGMVPPLAFILIRVAGGSLLFWLFHLAFIREGIDKKDWLRFVLCGMTGAAINQMLFFVGLERTSPINAALIQTTAPVVVLMIAVVSQAERLTGRKLLGIAIGAAGAIWLILAGKSGQLGSGNWTGDIMIVLNASIYGVYLIMARSLIQRYHPVTVVKWVFTAGILFVLPFSYRDFTGIDWAQFTPAIWGSVAYVLLGTTFLAYLFNAIALRTAPPSLVSAYIYLQPLTATCFALWMGKDQLSWLHAAAGALILSGVYLAGSRNT